MRKRSAILACVALLLILGIVVWRSTRPHEPLYQGKTVGYWLRHPNLRPITVSIVPSHVIVTNVEFPHLDSNAIPALRQALYTKDGILDAAYQSTWNKLPRLLRRGLPTPVNASTIQGRAALLLSRMAPEYPPATTALIEASQIRVVHNAIAGNPLPYPNAQPIHQFLSPFGIHDPPGGTSAFYDANHFQKSADIWSTTTSTETHSYSLPVSQTINTN